MLRVWDEPSHCWHYSCHSLHTSVCKWVWMCRKRCERDELQRQRQRQQQQQQQWARGYRDVFLANFSIAFFPFVRKMKMNFYRFILFRRSFFLLLLFDASSLLLLLLAFHMDTVFPHCPSSFPFGYFYYLCICVTHIHITHIHGVCEWSTQLDGTVYLFCW